MPWIFCVIVKGIVVFLCSHDPIPATYPDRVRSVGVRRDRIGEEGPPFRTRAQRMGFDHWAIRDNIDQ